MRLLQSEVRDIAAVLKAWSSPDDWNLSSILVSTARELIADLAAGDDPAALIRAAQDAARPGDDAKLTHHKTRKV